MGPMKIAYNFLLEHMKGRGHLGDLGADGTIVLTSYKGTCSGIILALSPDFVL
jgi:hypothetical protein